MRQYTQQEKQDLLTEAYIRYPKGTVFYAASGDRSTWTAGGNYIEWKHRRWDKGFAIYNVDGHGLVYAHEKWAEIVEPKNIKSKKKNNSLIPQIFN